MFYLYNYLLTILSVHLALMSRIEQENHAHQEAFTHLQEQLASNVSEKHTLMEEMEGQIKYAYM